MGTDHQATPSGDGSDVPVRVLCNGKTSAFQADDTGSIPVTRLQLQSGGHLAGQQNHQAVMVKLNLDPLKGFGLFR